MQMRMPSSKPRCVGGSVRRHHHQSRGPRGERARCQKGGSRTRRSQGSFCGHHRTMGRLNLERVPCPGLLPLPQRLPVRAAGQMRDRDHDLSGPLERHLTCSISGNLCAVRGRCWRGAREDKCGRHWYLCSLNRGWVQRREEYNRGRNGHVSQRLHELLLWHHKR